MGNKTVNSMISRFGFIFMAISANVLAQPDRSEKPIYFDITGRNVGMIELTDAIIQFTEFKFKWGWIVPYAAKSYSGVNARTPPVAATLSWTSGVSGKMVEINVPVPALPDRFNGLGYRWADGKYEREGLILRFDIDPDAKSVCAVWTTVAFPRDEVRCQ